MTQLATITSACPVCGDVQDCATNLEDKSLRPTVGDLSICIKCAAVLIFEENGRRVFTSLERLTLSIDKNRYIDRVTDAIKKIG